LLYVKLHRRVDIGTRADGDVVGFDVDDGLPLGAIELLDVTHVERRRMVVDTVRRDRKKEKKELRP